MKQSQQKLPSTLLKEIKANRPEYLRLNQLAIYSQLKKIDLAVFSKSSHDFSCNIFFSFDSSKYNSLNKQEIKVYIIRMLNEEIPKLKNKFSIAYVHGSISSFICMKEVLKILPAEHLRLLKHFYIINPSIPLKVIQKISFGTINEFLGHKVIYSNTIQEIEEKHKITFGGEISKSKLGLYSSKNKIKSPLIHKTKENEESVTNIIQNELYGKQLAAYQPSLDGIPLVIQNLVTKLYSCSQFLQTEGIMRKNCDIDELEKLENKIIEDGPTSHCLMAVDNPFVLCGCLKKIFNNLFTPLFSYELYHKIIEYHRDENKQNQINFVCSCLSQMSSLNKRVLFYMLAFLLKGVVANVQTNKMSEYNLAVVFGPCFFRPKEFRLEDLMYSGKFSSVISILLTNFEEIVGKQLAEQLFSLLDCQKTNFLKSE